MTIPLNDTVTWEKASDTLDDETEPVSFASPQTLAVWFTQRTEQVINVEGEEVTSQSRIHLPGDIAVGFNDRFTLPDGRIPPVVAIAKPRTPDGVFMTRVWF